MWTVKLHLALFLKGSCAKYTTTVLPIWNLKLVIFFIAGFDHIETFKPELSKNFKH